MTMTACAAGGFAAQAAPHEVAVGANPHNIQGPPTRILLETPSPKAQPPNPTLLNQSAAAPTAVSTVSEKPENVSTLPSPTIQANPDLAAPSPTPASHPVLLPIVEPPSGSNPLTGLPVTDPELLNRRPLAIKITNFPRDVRPQWGLSLADIVYEYYLEHGLTRFIALFYGNDAARVGPVRSGRFFDEHIVRMYKSIFVFANADRKVLDYFLETELVNYFVVERRDNCPPICRDRYRGGYNNLFTNTAQLTEYIRDERRVENDRPDLTGMVFDILTPEGGLPGTALQTYYSTYSYGRWVYEPNAGRYQRFQELTAARDGHDYFGPLYDRLTQQQVQADNVVILFVPHQYYSEEPEIVIMDLRGRGPALAFRDGKVFQTIWIRESETSVLSLNYPNGLPFPYKPGVTFYQVMGQKSRVWQFGDEWQFDFQIP